MLFGREFHVRDVLKLWDAIFADDKRLGSIDYICVSMILYLREQLLQSDVSGCLSRLMKFPPIEDVLWLFERAIKIRDAPQNQKPIPINSPPPAFQQNTQQQQQPSHPLSHGSDHSRTPKVIFFFF